MAFSCGKEPKEVDFLSVAAYVVGKEYCNSNEAEDYWIVDCSVAPNTPQLGGAVMVDGTTYVNALKVKELSEHSKIRGARVLFDYRVISPNPVVSENCTVDTPIVYALKELFILNQFELR